MTASWIWELGNQAQNRIPDPIDYIEMRRKTFGSDLTMSLSRLAHHRIVPDEVYMLRPVARMENSAVDYACLLNDVFSYQKEIQFEGEIHNGVLVVQNFLDCDAATAMRVVGDLMAARMRQFRDIVAVELPELFDVLHLDAATREALLSHAGNLENWLAGILNWHQGCHRYAEADLIGNARPARPDLFRTPTGLGTSAVRILRTLQEAR
jgi:germacradienol/geosmin synthase